MLKLRSARDPHAATPDTLTVLGVDPGSSTGIVIARKNPPALLHASVYTVTRDLPNDLKNLRAHLQEAIRGHTIDRVAIEGWQNIGRLTNLYAGIAQVMIGAFTVAFTELGFEPRFLFSGDWKRQYGSDTGFLPEAVGRVRKEDVGLARRIQADLGGWPTALDAVTNVDRGHAINAAALAIHAMNDRVWREASTYPIRIPSKTTLK